MLFQVAFRPAFLSCLLGRYLLLAVLPVVILTLVASISAGGPVPVPANFTLDPRSLAALCGAMSPQREIRCEIFRCWLLYRRGVILIN